MNPTRPFIFATIAWLVFPAFFAEGTTLTVPTDYPTIQAAIDAAYNGDTVIVLDGTYTGTGNRDIDFCGKAITVRSMNGPADCIVDCQSASLQEMHRGFYFHNGEDNGSVLEGFTITNGFHGDGGGIRCQGASPIIRNNVITGNTAEDDGDGGGAISCFSGGSPVIANNVIVGNNGGVGGGGIRCFDVDAPLIAGNVIAENVAGWGGGIVCDWCVSPTIVSNTITGNTAEHGSGGGLSTWGYATIVNNLIAGNTSNGEGGGIHCGEVSAPVITNNTMAGNTAVHGGGIASTFGASPIMTNCILWGNAAGWGPEISLHYASNYGPVTLTVRHCDVAGGATAAYVDPFCTLDWDGSNLADDPLFLAPADGNYHLSSRSPCIDSGDTVALPPDLFDLDGDGDTSEPIPFDLDRNARIVGGTVDMGAYEFQGAVPPPARLCVDTDATGANNGTSWVDAFNDLQDALDTATSWPGIVREIWVADGAYRPSARTDPLDPRTATFQLINGVALYGGFAGGETELAQRDIAANEAVLSGDLAGNDGPNFANNDENSYHVVTGSGTDATAILDGFTLTAGNANSFAQRFGEEGGGMFVLGTFVLPADPTVANCIFRGNWAYGGGGLYYRRSSLTLVNCTFTSNTAREYGGAVRNFLSTGAFTNCTFTGNWAFDGGAVHNDTSRPFFVGCALSGNRAPARGGAMFNEACVPTLINCTFSGNVTEGLGGGMLNESTAMVTNCIFWGNRDCDGEGETAQIRPPHEMPVVNSSCIQGWTGTWGGTGNHGLNPLFVDADGPDNIVGTEDDDLRLRSGSPCIDAGDNTSVPPDMSDLDDDGDTTELLPLDLDGNARFVDDPRTPDTGSGTPPIVDMGAYEYVPAAGLRAEICIHPRTLNLKSQGKWITCWIELPRGHDVRDIDVSSLLLNGTVHAAAHPTAVGDHDEDNIPDLMVKFPRDQVIAILNVGENVPITVTGTVAGKDFQGTDSIRVINPGIGPQRATPGHALEFSVAILAEGLTGTVTYLAENLPAGAILDATTGWFRWTPTPEQAGVYQGVVFRATNGLDEIVESITITVEITTSVRPVTWTLYR